MFVSYHNIGEGETENFRTLNHSKPALHLCRAPLRCKQQRRRVQHQMVITKLTGQFFCDNCPRTDHPLLALSCIFFLSIMVQNVSDMSNLSGGLPARRTLVWFCSGQSGRCGGRVQKVSDLRDTAPIWPIIVSAPSSNTSLSQAAAIFANLQWFPIKIMIFF